MRILVVTNKPLNSLTSGYDLRVWNLCEALKVAGHRLRLVVIPLNAQSARDCVTLPDASTIFEQVDEISATPSPKQSALRHFRLTERSFFRSADPSFHATVCSQLTAISNSFVPERVIYFGSNLAGFRADQCNAPHYVDVCDSAHLTLDRQFAASPVTVGREMLRRELQLFRWKMAEGSLARDFHRIAAISPEDCKRLSSLNDGAPVEVIPNGVGAAFLSSGAFPVATRRGVVFWGNLGFLPNAEAIQFFYEEVYRPFLAPIGVEFSIIGANAPAWLSARSMDDRGIRLLGFVRDIQEIATSYPVMVAPLISGSGLKNKVLEAFAMGIAVVATPMACEAIPEAVEGVHYLGGATPDQLGKAINSLLDDGPARTRLANSARELVERHYTWECVGNKWRNWVEGS